MIRPTILASAIGLSLAVSGCAELGGSPQAALDSPRAQSTTAAQPTRAPAGVALLERERRVIETNNVLAVLQAKQGQYQKAEQLLLASIAQAPQAAYLYNNLGYVYLLDGQLERARTTFEQAAQIAPDDTRVLANLAKVAERMTQREAAAAPTPASEAKAKRTAESQQPVQSIAAATDTLTIVTPATGTLVVAQVAPNVYEIRDPMQKLAEAPVPTVVAKAIQPQKVESLDVVNGNGVTGMARRVATQLHTVAGFPVARLFNQVPYNQRTTLIQYRQGMLAAATRIQSELPGNSEVVLMQSQTSTPTDIRILLGHDAVSWPVAWSGHGAASRRIS